MDNVRCLAYHLAVTVVEPTFISFIGQRVLNERIHGTVVLKSSESDDGTIRKIQWRSAVATARHLTHLRPDIIRLSRAALLEA
ncbi:hypothetical protein [Paraburkholderia nemoris]|jgi:hypothetical protein|uniref:hypothetical protein n=1 Tax=Paraburkholderia nemoris TaxID=2793076 RepID=UPI001B8D2EEE|nr:hypothetical protein [Paraburkholderia nemoris]